MEHIENEMLSIGARWPTTELYLKLQSWLIIKKGIQTCSKLRLNVVTS